MAPVPSVCVRVPHSPSLDSGDDPGTPTKDTSQTTFKYYLDTSATSTEFATLAVRECAIQMHDFMNFSYPNFFPNLKFSTCLLQFSTTLLPFSSLSLNA